ncbi:MarR family winged helix-turn-helix transcriptional regulator [Catellatospora chokoriensis]|uniref:Putative MarR-family transcriptional regulator n=1 Tax=Catellatospora chokoriensis TaxID=310353 RepID=A0A8J3K6G1_9ACTN|nr:MarR family transcriptional regulator [Catellatospora chokoriensis]GIF93727.1 putative MarR-family transcriptional regulator [Catellatospora chokoriensis]
MVAQTARTLQEQGADVTLTQYRTLVVLASRGPQRAADLAADLGVQPSTVSRLIDRLVQRGLVVRRQDATDRRVVWMTLTGQGKDLVGTTMRQRRQRLSELLATATATVGSAPGVVNLLNAIAQAAGEQPDEQWWRSWESSTGPHLGHTAGRDAVAVATSARTTGGEVR